MDNPLTPRKIRRLMCLAEDKSFNDKSTRKLDMNMGPSIKQTFMAETNKTSELSSGILDLENCEGFGDSAMASITNSTSFVPAEMTGRSTGTNDVTNMQGKKSEFERFAENSLELLTLKLNQQSNDVKDVMRQSIASTFSLHSKRDLTADEASFIIKEAPLPALPSQINMNLQESIVSERSVDPAELSMGAYFQRGCMEFSNIIPHVDSPKYNISVGSNVTSDTSFMLSGKPSSTKNRTYKLEHEPLDSIPTKIPKVPEIVTSCSTPDPIKETPRASVPAKRFLLDPTKQHIYAGLQTTMEETNTSEYDSLSISKIANFLGKDSTIGITDILQQTTKPPKKVPLTEKDMNIHNPIDNHQVVTLKESKKYDSASSAGSVNTVIEQLSKLKTDGKLSIIDCDQSISQDHQSKTRSLSNKSSSTLSTVKEYKGSGSFKLSDSPILQQNSPDRSGRGAHQVSPNMVYKELDESVDWKDVLQATKGRFKRESLPQVVQVNATEVSGFVGVNATSEVTVKSQSDSWLTARFVFDSNQNDLTIELPRFPKLLTPGKTEMFTVNIVSNTELSGVIPFVMYAKDPSLDNEIEVKGEMAVGFRLPALQAISAIGMNKLSFQNLIEGSTMTKTFILISDCSADLQLDMTVNNNMFAISSIQEINKNDITKKLLDGTDDKKRVKCHKQLCRLSNGNALRVVIAFTAPILTDAQTVGDLTQFNGSLNVNLIGCKTVLTKVEFTATVGYVQLKLDVPNDHVNVTKDPLTIQVCNIGSVEGRWNVSIKGRPEDINLFNIHGDRCMVIKAGDSMALKISYMGSSEQTVEGSLQFEEAATNQITTINLTSENPKPTVFPIKTNHSTMSWVRNGKKELSLKNCTEKRVYMKCKIVGEGFSIDLPKAGCTQIASLVFGPCECRPLTISFDNGTGKPCSAILYLAHEKDTELSRKITLFGHSAGDTLRWFDHMTYGQTSLVKALPKQPIDVKLFNRSKQPAFVFARVHFNVQFLSVASSARLIGGRTVVPPRGTCSIRLNIDWSQVDKCRQQSSALASITVFTGAELTRRRILRVLKNNSGEIDTKSLPEHLKCCAGPYDNEDSSMDALLSEFNETKASLYELMRGLQEMTAQIELTQEFTDENTILISDDTVIEHHTLCD